MRYALDDEPFISVGSFTKSNRLVISGPDQPASFTFVQIELELHTTDPLITPVIYSLELKAWLQKLDKAFELLIQCFDESSTFHIAGDAVPGGEAIDYLFDLATETGGLVEFEDAYTRNDPADSQVYNVLLEEPDLQMLQAGSGLVHLRLTERNL
jgi:hypothetical protein